MNQDVVADPGWKSLYTAGGVAALLAGVVLRRNLAAEISLFSTLKQPGTVADTFALLQRARLLGLAYLNIFDVANYALLAVVFLALLAVLWRASKSTMAIATMLALLGIAVYMAANTALSMLALSDQYAAATTLAQKDMLLGAGQALMALNRFGSAGAQPGSGGYLSLFLVAFAGLMVSLVMLRSAVFGRWTAWVGILAGALDLAYCVAYAFVPGASGAQLALFFIPAAGLFWMIWHILVGIRLLRLGRLEGTISSTPSTRR